MWPKKKQKLSENLSKQTKGKVLQKNLERKLQMLVFKTKCITKFLK